jgi:aquaporin Z
MTKTAAKSTQASDPTRPPSDLNRWAAELVGTFLLVLGGCGTAILAGAVVGWLGVSLAFGLTVVVGAYAFGPISGGHFNPAITIGLATAGRFAWKDVLGDVVAQIVGGALATSVIALVLQGGDGLFAAAREAGFASNGYGEFSPAAGNSTVYAAGFGMSSAIVIETVLTMVFVLVVLGTTRKIANPAMAGLAIGLALSLIHLISIPVDNTSVNPARSIAAAIYGGTDHLAQLWVFIVFPILGGVLAGLLDKPLFERK